jgi:hypothetical protein
VTVMVTAPLIRDPLGDTGLVTEPEPTPVFRRFPWTQLVFCVACLSMTAWTWMRHSYCRTVSPLLQQRPRSEAGYGPLNGRYGLISGRIRLATIRRWCSKAPIRLDQDESPAHHFVALESTSGVMGVRVLADQGREFLPGQEVVLRGRLTHVARSLAIDTTASRFTGASIAGLVVGAMGCFIFGLYLRGWLRERKALASQPERDMIA